MDDDTEMWDKAAEAAGTGASVTGIINRGTRALVAMEGVFDARALRAVADALDPPPPMVRWWKELWP